MESGEHPSDVPSLAVVRPMLSPRVLEWVNAVLAGVTEAEFRGAHGSAAHTSPYGRYFAEAAGLPDMRHRGTIREAVLRARIRELEEAR